MNKYCKNENTRRHFIELKFGKRQHRELRHAVVSSTSGVKGHTKMAPSKRKHATSSACVIPGGFTGIAFRNVRHLSVSYALMYMYSLRLSNLCFVSVAPARRLPSGIARD